MTMLFFFLSAFLFSLKHSFYEDNHAAHQATAPSMSKARTQDRPITHGLLAKHVISTVQDARYKETTDRIIVKYRNKHTLTSINPSLNDVNTLVKKHDLLPYTINKNSIRKPVQALRATLLGSIVFQLDHFYSVHELKKLTTQLTNLDKNIEYAEPDTIKTTTQDRVENPSYFSYLPWSFDRHNSDNGINIIDAWHFATGKQITVAVLDTGYLPHPDLLPNIVGGYTMNEDRGPDAIDPGNWSTQGECGADSLGQDSSWHGTHVAGTIAALPNETAGASGIAYDAKILPVRVLGKCGGYDSDIIDGMIWAANAHSPSATLPINTHPARVINMSLGSIGHCTLSYQEAIAKIRSKGTVIVASAGNNNQHASNHTPSNCAGVISVAAYNPWFGTREDSSNYGEGVTIAAPGRRVLSTHNDGKTKAAHYIYSEKDGTSMAAPHVSGVVALMLSINPFLTPDQVTQLLANTARPFGAGKCDEGCGAGMLDAGAAVRAAYSIAIHGNTVASSD